MNIRIDEQVILKSLRKTVEIIDTRTQKAVPSAIQTKILLNLIKGVPLKKMMPEIEELITSDNPQKGANACG